MRIPEGAAPDLKNKSYQITAEVEIPASGAEGMLLTHRDASPAGGSTCSRASRDETLDCGEDTGTPVSEDYHAPFKFTGELKQVTVYLKPAPLSAQGQRTLEDGKSAAAVRAQ